MCPSERRKTVVFWPSTAQLRWRVSSLSAPARLVAPSRYTRSSSAEVARRFSGVLSRHPIPCSQRGRTSKSITAYCSMLESFSRSARIKAARRRYASPSSEESDVSIIRIARPVARSPVSSIAGLTMAKNASPGRPPGSRPRSTTCGEAGSTATDSSRPGATDPIDHRRQDPGARSGNALAPDPARARSLAGATGASVGPVTFPKRVSAKSSAARSTMLGSAGIRKP